MASRGQPDYTVHNAAWVGSALVFADDDVVENKLRRPLLSPSVAAGYNSCPARTAIDRLIPRVDDPFLPNRMGNVFHPIMEQVYALDAPSRTLENALSFLRKKGDEQWAISKLEKSDKSSLKANAENRANWESTIAQWLKWQFLIEDPTQIEVAGIEDLLDNVTVGAGVGGADGIPLKGYVDRTDWVTVDGVRYLAIRDYKTGKPKVKLDARYGDDYGDQLRIYTEGYAQKTGERPNEALLIFPRGLENIANPEDVPRDLLRKQAIRSVDLSPNATKQTLLGFRAGWETMNASCDKRSFEARPSALCGWCPAVNSCPVANVRSANAQSAAAGQPSALQLGIPRLRPGASMQEVKNAPGVSVPVNREPDFVTPIQPANGDLFPVTLETDADANEVSIPSEIAAPAETTQYQEQIFAAAQEVAAAGFAEHPLEDVFDVDAVNTVHVEFAVPNNTPNGSGTMTTDQPITAKAEAPPYEAEINGVLNLNSYSAIAVSGIVATAFEHMNEQKVTVGATALNAFSHILAGIVLRTQKRVTGFANFQSGSNTRLRGFLRMALDAFPAPFRVLDATGTTMVPATVDDWQAWIGRVEKLLTASLTTAESLYNSAHDHMGSTPETFFATGGQGAPEPILLQAK
jgi:putative RecB family exonuclease